QISEGPPRPDSGGDFVCRSLLVCFEERNTSMNTAIGDTITESAQELAGMLPSVRPDKVIFVIFTDGLEKNIGRTSLTRTTSGGGSSLLDPGRSMRKRLKLGPKRLGLAKNNDAVSKKPMLSTTIQTVAAVLRRSRAPCPSGEFGGPFLNTDQKGI